jgi:hypothetical protein
VFEFTFILEVSRLIFKLEPGDYSILMGFTKSKGFFTIPVGQPWGALETIIIKSTSFIVPFEDLSLTFTKYFELSTAQEGFHEIRPKGEILSTFPPAESI